MSFIAKLLGSGGSDAGAPVATAQKPRSLPTPEMRASQQPASAGQRQGRQVAPQSRSAAERAQPGRSASGDGEAAANAPKRVKEADRELLVEIEAFKGRVLTAPDGVAPITQEQREFAAMLDNSMLLVSKSHAMHHDVSSVRSLLRRKGIVWRMEVHVDLDVIRGVYERAEKSAPGTAVRADTAQMQRAFMELLGKAAQLRASDVHLVVHRYEAMVEFRIDSVVVKVEEMRASAGLEMCQAAFNMSDVSDPTYMPMEQQGARITEASLKGLKFPEGVQSVRLQFSPLPNLGRYMVARLLYSQTAGSNSDIDELGYAPVQIHQIKEMRRRPYGINVVSGPTGSGKSTTLQRGLIAVMRERPGINVLTIEDPPEYVIPGAKQIPVSNAATAEERTEKFRQAITGSLRLDPDVIMIGEMRDRASANLAFQAAMTGHGVWTTLHANDAVSILDRLRDMGVEIYNLCDASLVTGLIGQRLVRLTKPEDSIPFEEGVERGYLEADAVEALRKLLGGGVSGIRFAGTGTLTDRKRFKGRTVVAETVLTDQKFLDLFRDGRKQDAIGYWLDHLKGITMLEHAFFKMCGGAVDPREVQDKIGLIASLRADRVGRVLDAMGRGAGGAIA